MQIQRKLKNVKTAARPCRNGKNAEADLAKVCASLALVGIVRNFA
jgi:hypothetical protein